MKKLIVACIVLGLAVGVARAQDVKMKKKEAVSASKAVVAEDKADLKRNAEAREDDKMRGDHQALKADRKARMRGEGKLLKDQVKKESKVIKEKL